MKVKYLPTGCVWESENELTVDQWKKHPELYKEVTETPRGRRPKPEQEDDAE